MTRSGSHRRSTSWARAWRGRRTRRRCCSPSWSRSRIRVTWRYVGRPPPWPSAAPGPSRPGCSALQTPRSRRLAPCPCPTSERGVRCPSGSVNPSPAVGTARSSSASSRTRTPRSSGSCSATRRSPRPTSYDWSPGGRPTPKPSRACSRARDGSCATPSGQRCCKTPTARETSPSPAWRSFGARTRDGSGARPPSIPPCPPPPAPCRRAPPPPPPPPLPPVPAGGAPPDAPLRRGSAPATALSGRRGRPRRLRRGPPWRPLRPASRSASRRCRRSRSGRA